MSDFGLRTSCPKSKRAPLWALFTYGGIPVSVHPSERIVARIFHRSCRDGIRTSDYREACFHQYVRGSAYRLSARARSNRAFLQSSACCSPHSFATQYDAKRGILCIRRSLRSLSCAGDLLFSILIQIELRTVHFLLLSFYMVIILEKTAWISEEGSRLRLPCPVSLVSSFSAGSASVFIGTGWCICSFSWLPFSFLFSFPHRRPLYGSGSPRFVLIFFLFSFLFLYFYKRCEAELWLSEEPVPILVVFMLLVQPPVA